MTKVTVKIGNYPEVQKTIYHDEKGFYYTTIRNMKFYVEKGENNIWKPVSK